MSIPIICCISMRSKRTIVMNISSAAITTKIKSSFSIFLRFYALHQNGFVSRHKNTMFLVCYNIKRNVLRLLNNLHIILSDNSPSSTFCNIKSSINIVTNIIITIKIYLYQNALSNSIL